MMMSVLPEGISLPNGGPAINHKSPRDALPRMQVHPGPILHAGDTHRSLGKAQGSHASNPTLPSSLGREEGNPSPPTPCKPRGRVDRRFDPRHKPLNRDLHGLPASPLHSRASLGSASVLRARDASLGLTSSSSSSSASSSASPPPSASFLPPRGPGPDALGPGLDPPHPHRSGEKGGSNFQSLSQSVVDCFGSLRVHGPSPEELPNESKGKGALGFPGARGEEGEEEGGEGEGWAMQSSQDMAGGFRLKSVGAVWDEEEGAEMEAGGGLRGEGEGEQGRPRAMTGGSTSLDAWGGRGGGREDEAGGEVVRVVSIPACNLNPFGPPSSRASEDLPEGRKRTRPRKIKIPCSRGTGEGGREGAGGGGEGEVSRYLLEFEQLETIGAGRFSLVHKVRKRLDGWVYAIKRSRHSLVSEGEKEGAMREVYALAALQGCPHLVRYMSAWMEASYLFIQTEYCPGGSLERAVFDSVRARGEGAGEGAGEGGGERGPGGGRRGRREAGKPVGGAGTAAGVVDGEMNGGKRGEGGGYDGSEACLLRVARDVGGALDFMHSRGIVHMDVKPGNIFIAADGSFKLGDLGHAIKADGSMHVLEGDERCVAGGKGMGGPGPS